MLPCATCAVTSPFVMVPATSASTAATRWGARSRVVGAARRWKSITGEPRPLKSSRAEPFLRGMKRRARGFTLIELMIVVAIVGVLAVLAVFSIRKYMANAKTAEARDKLGQIAK